MQYNEKLMQMFDKFADLLQSKDKVDEGLIATAKEIAKEQPEVLTMDWTRVQEKMPNFANTLKMSQYSKDSKLMAYCKKAGLFKKSVNDGIFMLTRKKAEIVKTYGDTIYFKLKGSNIKGEKKVHGLCHNAESNFSKVFNKVKKYASNKGGKPIKQHFGIYLDKNMASTISPLNTVLNTKDKYSQNDMQFCREIKQAMDTIHSKVTDYLKKENIKEIINS